MVRVNKIIRVVVDVKLNTTEGDCMCNNEGKAN